MINTVIGYFEIQRLLGSGGIGNVHAALDLELGREVALKALLPQYSRDASFVERFRAEAASLARLNHPNIATLYSLHRQGPSDRPELYLVMELVHGQTLKATLGESGRLGVRACLAVIAQAAAGLSYAHRMRVVHRDVKPSNLMLTNAGRLKIIDFGLARVHGSERLTREGTLAGTLTYMAPEQTQGIDGDERSDLYSLACVLYEMLSGHPPFRSVSEYELIRAHAELPPESLMGRIPGVDARVERALSRALAKKPDERFQSVAEFAHILGAAAMEGEAAEIVRETLASAPGTVRMRALAPAFAHEPLAGQSSVEPASSHGSPSRASSVRSRWLPMMLVGSVATVAAGYLAYYSSLAPDATMTAQSVREPPVAAIFATAEPQHGESQPCGSPRGEPQPGPRNADPTAEPQPLPGVPAARAGPEPPLAGTLAGTRASPAESPLPAGAPPPATIAPPSQPIAGDVESYSAEGWPVVAGTVFRLYGVSALSVDRVERMKSWVRRHGNFLLCEAANVDSYRCVTKQDLDMSQAVLLNGAARASADAEQSYRDAEQQAREAKRGLWK